MFLGLAQLWMKMAHEGIDGTGPRHQFNPIVSGNCDRRLTGNERQTMKKNRPLRSKTFAVLLLAMGFLTSGIVPAAYANLIVNGGFESPAVPEGGSGVTPVPWTFPNPFAGGGAVIHPPDGLGPLYPSAQEGLQYERLFSGGVIAQAFHATAGDYQLTWYDNSLTDRFTRYNVYVMAGPIPTVGQIIANFVPPILATADFEHFHGDATVWNARSLSMTLATGDYFVLFSNGNSLGTRPFGAGVVGPDDFGDYLLDNVSLDAVVPEPSTLFASAFLGLLFASQSVRQLRNCNRAKSSQVCLSGWWPNRPWRT